MIADPTESEHGVLSGSYRLDAAPEKVWRAVSEAPLRAAWLPDQRVIEVLGEEPQQEIELLIEERNAPFEKSVVRFGLSPLPDGGTLLSILDRPHGGRAAGNDNAPLMLAA